MLVRLVFVGRDLDGTAQSLSCVEREKEELNSLTVNLQESIEVRKDLYPSKRALNSCRA